MSEKHFRAFIVVLILCGVLSLVTVRTTGSEGTMTVEQVANDSIDESVVPLSTLHSDTRATVERILRNEPASVITWTISIGDQELVTISRIEQEFMLEDVDLSSLSSAGYVRDGDTIYQIVYSSTEFATLLPAFILASVFWLVALVSGLLWRYSQT